jgi:ParB family chromosome partitioning protein
MDSMKPTEIRTQEPFVNLFPIKPEVLRKIEDHMRVNQFLVSHPLDLATWEGQKDAVCIDGHTRLQAAINAELDKVFVITHELGSEDEALALAIHLQKNRRNMTDVEIVKCVEVVDARKQRGGDRKSEVAKSKPQRCGIEESRSASAKHTGDIVGVSARKVEQIRTIKDHGGEDIVESVKKGAMSINRAYQATQKRRRNTKAVTETKGSMDAKEESQADRKGRSDRTMKRSDDQSPCPDAIGNTSVILTLSHYKALAELEGSISDHVCRAINMYLESLRESDLGKRQLK